MFTQNRQSLLDDSDDYYVSYHRTILTELPADNELPEDKIYSDMAVNGKDNNISSEYFDYKDMCWMLFYATPIVFVFTLFFYIPNKW